MNKFKLIALIALIASFSNSLLANDFKECQNVASDLNVTLPMNIDKVTQVVGTVCVPSSKRGKKVKFVYSLEISDTRITKKGILSLRSKQVNFWCSNPTQKNMLKQFDVKYSYNMVNGTYLGANSFTIKDCR